MKYIAKGISVMVLAIVFVLTGVAMHTPGIGGSGVQPVKAEVITEYVTVYVEVPASHLADSCHEDEDWATVHYQTPGAVDDMHGVTRMCVNHEDLVLQGVNELILDGWLSWAWDLPDAPVPWTGGQPRLLS